MRKNVNDIDEWVILEEFPYYTAGGYKWEWKKNMMQ